MNNNSATLTSIGVGVCISHTSPIPMVGVIITGASSVIINSLNSGFRTSIVLGYCGHIGIIVSASSTVTSSDLNKAKVGSIFVGPFTGVIVTGQSGVVVGG